MTRHADARRALGQLAKAHGVQASYTDVEGKRRRAGSATLVGVLRALGAPLETERDAPAALRDHEAAMRTRALEPVTVAWDGRLPAVTVRTGPGAAHARVEIETEDGEHRGWDVTTRARRAVVQLEDRLPLGRHRLRVSAGEHTHEAWILAAPRQAYDPALRAWGVFAPVYALATSDRCVGGYRELHALARAVHSHGGDIAATLPMQAAFLDQPFELSPYAPASRLFWNELYVDAEALGAQPSVDQRAAMQACRAHDRIDYAAAARVQRALLQPLADRALSDAGNAAARAFANRDMVRDYARFRAVTDRQQSGWATWPQRLRAGTIRDGDYDAADARYHAFVQWAADVQLGAIAADEDAASMYLDMPLGVHGDSYDTWRYPELFASGASAGAPPDTLFRGGQDWGFPPMHPEAQRLDGYRYLSASLHAQLRFARLLRLDHVMSLYRLYWVPAGLPATEGVYVRYPEDELFATLTLESVRHHAVIVGEDLGTVPPAVRRRLTRHAIRRMHVMQYELGPDRMPQLGFTPERSVASLNTHDMPTFAGFWQGADLEDQRALELLDGPGERAAQENRAQLRRALARHLHLKPADSDADAPGAALDGLLERLAASPANVALVNLEDLWLEDRPQNVPGTTAETRPNWRRPLRYDFPDVLARDDVRARLARVNDARGRSTPRTARSQEPA